MKKITFTVMIVFVAMFSAVAQTVCGGDVVVGTVGENRLTLSNKIAVANNDLMYPLSLIDDLVLKTEEMLEYNVLNVLKKNKMSCVLLNL